ncbi:MAG TPA: hypothetical protein VGH90_00530 [Chthoniobacteraceae bacterium]|jgi:hypothetical protein
MAAEKFPGVYVERHIYPAAFVIFILEFRDRPPDLQSNLQSAFPRQRSIPV